MLSSALTQRNTTTTIRIYHTFRDAESVDHAQFSADLLFKEGLINDYTEALKATDPDRKSDADKIDILRVNRETPMTQIYNLPDEAFLTSEISDPVYEDMLAHRDVNRVNSKTGADFMMGHIAFVYGLVYPISFQIVEEQGYLEQMLAFESRNERTRERMERIREEVRGYIQKQI